MTSRAARSGHTRRAVAWSDQHDDPTVRRGAGRGVWPGSPDDLGWLADLVRDSPLLPERGLRQHWLRLLPWLDADARYQLAATLVTAEHRLARLPC